MDYIEIEAKTVKEAIKKALAMLHATHEEDIEIQVLSEEKMGLFGRPGGRGAKIRASLKKT